MSAPACRRGEVWRVNFNPGRGSEQKGVRPALVVQNDVGNQHSSTTIVAAITTTVKKYPMTVVLEKGEAGLISESMVNLAQILTIDKARLMKKFGELKEDRMMEIDTAIALSMGLPK